MDHSAQGKLDQIAADIVENNVCPDLAKTAKHLVFGEGNPNAKIIFIGEAPGRNEDETGVPFIGAAGKFLDELLQDIGLLRKDVYITSILKYRPPKNRDPLPAEKAEFWPYLQAQLEVIQPQLVVTLGRHSLNCFLPKAKIGEVHGKPQPWQGYTILPLYHPAAVLYNSKMRQTLFDDFAVINTLLS
ncbi:MAG TPA: uracil-DNA glycosylase [Candidatus Saccharimonadales bacterium]|nr:uracil-DNA glycosylase [Candidatus Saccharimonadales bacterium]